MVYRVHHSGFRIAEIPILFEQRTHGASKIDEREIYRTPGTCWSSQALGLEALG